MHYMSSKSFTKILLTTRFLCASTFALRHSEPKLLNCAVTVLREFPHVGTPFTQGLEFASNGYLVESVGAWPRRTASYVRLLDPQTGHEIRRAKQREPVFVEGIAEMGGHWFASTYKDNVVLEFDADLGFIKQHDYPHMGWGLAHSIDHKSFFATNGSEYIATLDPATFQAVDEKVAQCLGKRVKGINELEMVSDFLGRGPALIGNIIDTRLVLAVDPATGICSGVFQLTGEDMEPLHQAETLGLRIANGIAFESSRGTFYATGKNWDSMYEITVTADPEHSESIEALEQHLSWMAAEPA